MSTFFFQFGPPGITGPGAPGQAEGTEKWKPGRVGMPSAAIALIFPGSSNRIAPNPSFFFPHDHHETWL